MLLACGTTWLLALPLALSWLRAEPASPYMFALAGLSAFGPSFAAFVLAQRQGRLREVFGHFGARARWIVFALLLPLLLHLVARFSAWALGAEIDEWFWLPRAAPQIAALFFFSLGEEFGWRGFLHPVLVRRYGLTAAPLLTGLIWALWHLAYAITPEGTMSASGFALMLLEITLWAVIVAWLFERTQRSMLVAIAVHAGGHLDNSARIPQDATLLRALTLLAIAVAAAFGLLSLRRQQPPTRSVPP